MIIIFINLFILFLHINGELSPVVNILNGKIQGTVMRSDENTKFYAFQGIPYALPPLDELRFEPPQAIHNWTGIYQANTEKAACIQNPNPERLKNVNITEDCLFLSVYTPKLPSNGFNCTALPVMVWIHGGGFTVGYYSAQIYGPHYFMDYNVIVVTLNYRLGIFGFLSSGDDLLSGNSGLKDQLLALKWVKKNIHNFGGDPKRITLFGESSGGSSVAFHLLNKQNKQLFNSAILQSGTSLSTYYPYQINPRDNLFKVANYSGFNINNKTTLETLEYLKNVSAEILFDISKKVSREELTGSNEPLKNFLFGPIVENNHKDAFITSNAYNKLHNGNTIRIPIIIGYNSEEALGLAQSPDFINLLNEWNNNPQLLVSDNVKNDNEKTIIGNQIKQVYCKDKNFTSCLAGGVKFYGDTTIILPSLKHAQLQSQYSRVYFYKFSYSGPLGQSNFTLDGAEKVGHFQDIFYLWKNDNINLKDYPFKDIKTHKKLLKLWTNFAHTQNPTPRKFVRFLDNVCWKTFNRNQLNYLNINEKLQMKRIPRLSFNNWETIYGKYKINPYL